MGKYDVSAKEEVGSYFHKREVFLGHAKQSEERESELKASQSFGSEDVSSVEHYEFCTFH